MQRTAITILAQELDKALEQNFHMQRHLRKLNRPAGTVKLELKPFTTKGRDLIRDSEADYRTAFERRGEVMAEQATKIRELEEWKAHQLEVFAPFQDYMQRYPDMPLGESMVAKAIEFLEERLVLLKKKQTY